MNNYEPTLEATPGECKMNENGKVKAPDYAAIIRTAKEIIRKAEEQA